MATKLAPSAVSAGIRRYFAQKAKRAAHAAEKARADHFAGVKGAMPRCYAALKELRELDAKQADSLARSLGVTLK